VVEKRNDGGRHVRVSAWTCDEAVGIVVVRVCITQALGRASEVVCAFDQIEGYGMFVPHRRHFAMFVHTGHHLHDHKKNCSTLNGRCTVLFSA